MTIACFFSGGPITQLSLFDSAYTFAQCNKTRIRHRIEINAINDVALVKYAYTKASRVDEFNLR